MYPIEVGVQIFHMFRKHFCKFEAPNCILKLGRETIKAFFFKQFVEVVLPVFAIFHLDFRTGSNFDSSKLTSQVDLMDPI